MAIQRRIELDEKTRELLVDSAVEEFSKRGYDAASLNEILRKAGLSKGQFYYYFRGKAGLLRSLIEDMALDLQEKVGPIGPEPKSAREFWLQLGDAYARTLEYFVARPKQALLARILAQAYMHPDLAKDLAEYRALSQAFLLKKVEEGERLGAIRTDVPPSYIVATAQAILEVTDVWVTSSWHELGEQGLAKVPQMVLETIQRIAAPIGGPNAVRRPRKA